MIARITCGKNFALRIPDARLGERYTLVMPDGTALAGDGEAEVPCLGSGGFGVVVRAQDRLTIPRAVKFLTYARVDDLQRNVDSGNVFVREIEMANKQPYKHVIPITDYDVTTDADGQEFGYYVQPYVDGVTLDKWADALRTQWDLISGSYIFRSRLRDQTLTILSNIVAGLVELHAASVVHMDLKPRNLMVYPRTRNPLGIGPEIADGNSQSLRRRIDPLENQQCFIIDMGAAKAMTAGRRGLTPLMCTPFYFPLHLLSQLGHKRQGDVPFIDYERLSLYWRRIDLYSFGRTLEVLLLDQVRRDTPELKLNEDIRAREVAKEAFWRNVFGDDFAVLEDIAAQLTDLDKGTYETTLQVESALRAIPFHASTAILAADSLTDRLPGIRLRTGSHLIKASAPFHQIVDHFTFQRLRLRQQLSLVSEVFPDATHSRFTHSLQTFHLAKSFVMGLTNRSNFRALFRRQDIEHLLAAALLHDLGQYPFSHTIEDLRKVGDLCGEKALMDIKHDQELVSPCLDLPDAKGVRLRDILHDHELSVDQIDYLVSKRPKEGNAGPVANISRDIINGVIDVDRISYLSHDSIRTGVPYGNGIDIASLTEALTIMVGAEGTLNVAGLAVDETGVSAAEAVLAAVYWMYRNVYWRHTNRAFMAEVKHVMKRMLLERGAEFTFDTYLRDTFYFSDWEVVKYLRDTYDAFASQDGKQYYNPIASIADLRRIGHRRAFSLRACGDAECTLLYRVGTNINPAREAEVIRAIVEHLPRFCEPRDGDILVDVPLKPRLATSNRETAAEQGRAVPLYVKCHWPLTKRFRTWITLEEYSPLAQAVRKTEESVGMPFRVFFSRDLLDKLSSADMERIELTLHDVIVEVTAHW